MALVKKSEYLCSLSAEGRKRYTEKLNAAGLNTDPYCIDDLEWTREPEATLQLVWSDLMLYMVSTPSPYTKEAIKVNTFIHLTTHIRNTFRLGRACLTLRDL